MSGILSCMEHPATVTLEEIRAALQLPTLNKINSGSSLLPNSRLRARPPDMDGVPKQGAVLLLLYPNHSDAISIAFTKRPDTMTNHPGQISFPGGKQEPNETLQETALRETWEEIGIPAAAIQILGQLEQFYISPTDFQVQPFVGWLPATPAFKPNPSEVAAIIESPVRHLINPATVEQERWTIRGQRMLIPFYRVGEHKIWGATAGILAAFLGRLIRLRSQTNGSSSTHISAHRG